MGLGLWGFEFGAWSLGFGTLSSALRGFRGLGVWGLGLGLRGFRGLGFGVWVWGFELGG